MIDVNPLTVVPITLPHRGVYRCKELQWDRGGNRYFVPCEYRVMILSETEKSYRIRYSETGKESWVGKGKIKFLWLRQGFCEHKDRCIPNHGCKACFDKLCYFSGKDYPTQLY